MIYSTMRSSIAIIQSEVFFLCLIRAYLLGMEVSLLEKMDDQRKKAGIDDRLHLILVSSSYVGQEPDSFLKKYTIVNKGEQSEKFAIESCNR